MLIVIFARYELFLVYIMYDDGVYGIPFCS